jgi:dUTP pyrophosphatase
MSFQVKLLSSDAKVPTLGTASSAGYDLYCVREQTLKPGLNTIKLEIAVAIPEGYYGQIHDRSSMAKKGLTVSAGVVDSDYRGEVMILITNHNDETIMIKQHDRVAQLILHKIISPEVEVVDLLDETQRKGGFGSTGR